MIGWHKSILISDWLIQNTRDEKSQTRETESCGDQSEPVENKPLFVKKHQGRFFQTDVDPSDNSDLAPVPPPRSKSKESSTILHDRYKSSLSQWLYELVIAELKPHWPMRGQCTTRLVARLEERVSSWSVEESSLSQALLHLITWTSAQCRVTLGLMATLTLQTMLRRFRWVNTSDLNTVSVAVL